MRRPALAPLLLVPLVALATALTGCGSGGDEPGAAGTSTPPASPTTSSTEPSSPPTSSPSTSAPSADPADLPVLSWQGLGDVRFGMTPDEATEALGVELVPTETFEASRADVGCGYLEPAQGGGLPDGLGFMVTGPGDGVVHRIDVSEGPYRTDGGIGLGSDAADVDALQPEGIITAPSDVAVGFTTITVNPLDDMASTAQVFDVDPDDVVTAFRAGEKEEASWSEGCA